MKPVLQRFLLSRWSEFTARNPMEIKETSPQSLQANVGQVLFDWLVEALTHLNKVPQLWKKSFDLTGLLVGPKEENVELDNRTTADKRGGIQSELLTMLTEILLGAEASETESPDLLELEDEEDSEKEEQAVKEKETSEENQEDKKDEEKKEKEDREETGKESEQREQMEEEGKEAKEKGRTEEEMVEDEEEDGKNSEEKQEVKTIEEDSEEEGKETEEDRKEVSKERRETRIVIGEEVGDEWKITVKSRAEANGKEGSRKEES